MSCPTLALRVGRTGVDMRQASEDDQQRDEKEDTPCPDAPGWIATHVTADKRSVLAPVRPHIVIAAHFVPLTALWGVVSRTMVRFPLEDRRTVRRRPWPRCHTTIAVTITAMTARGMAAGG
jgi:hypothetical protein